MKLSSILNPDLIFYDLKGKNRESLYREMLTKMVDETDLKEDPEKLAGEMVARENSIRIPYAGMAMPHLRLDNISDLYVAIGIPKKPVKLQDFDSTETKIVVMSLISENTSDVYLKMLAAFSKYLKVPENVSKLAVCDTPRKFFDRLNDDGVQLKKDITAEDIMFKPDAVTPESPLREALDCFIRAQVATLPVVDSTGKLLGVVDALEVIHKSVPEYLFMMNHVKFLNSFEPFEKIFRDEYSQKVEEYMIPPKMVISPNTPLIQITMSLIRGEAQMIVVVDENNKYLGMVSVESIVHKILRG